MFARQVANGNWYVHRRTTSSKGQIGKVGSYTNWFMVKYRYDSMQSGCLQMKMLYFPEEFVGKKIRLKIEVIEE